MSEVMVVFAQPRKVVQGGLPVFDHGDDPVIDLQALSHVTAGDDTGLVPFDQSGAQGGSNGSAQVGDGGDVRALGDDQVQNGIAQDRPGRRQGDGTNARDLTALAVLEVAPAQGGEVDPEVDAGRWGVARRGAFGGRGVRVGRVGV